MHIRRADIAYSTGVQLLPPPLHEPVIFTTSAGDNKKWHVTESTPAWASLLSLAITKAIF